jgi:hypothetical protein
MHKSFALKSIEKQSAFRSAINSKGFRGLPEYPLLIALSLLAIILCAPIDNPYENPENIGIALSVAGDTALVYHSVSDTLRLAVALHIATIVKQVVIDWNSSSEKRDTIAVSTNKIDDTLTVMHVFSGEGNRTVRVSAVPDNSKMQASAEITIRIGRRPQIAGNGRVLVPEVLRPGDSCYLAVAATGSDTMRYDWYRNGILVSGAKRDTIFFHSLTRADTGSYRCIVSNGWGSDTSAVYHLADTLMINTQVRIAVTSPVMKADSAVVRTSLLAIAGTATSAAGIASVTIMVNDDQAAVVGTQAWSISVSELASGQWNRVDILAADGKGARDTLTVFLFFMPALSMPSAPVVKDRTCTSLDMSLRTIPPCTRSIVYRFSPDSMTLDTVMETADTLLRDSSLSPSRTYYYVCRGWYEVPGMKAIADTTDTSAMVTGKTAICFEKTFGGANVDDAAGVMVTPDSGCLVAGTSLSTRPGWSDVFLVRLDKSGDTTWTKSYGPQQNYHAVSLRPGKSGEAIVGGGYSCSSCGYGNVAFVTVFSLLDGSAAFSTTRDRLDWNPAYDALRSNAGGLAYASWRRPPAGLYANNLVDTVAYVCMMNAAGDSLWKKYLAFKDYNSKAWSAVQSNDGSMYVTGTISLSTLVVGGAQPQPNCFVAKLSAAGDSLWSHTYGTTTTYTKGAQIRAASDGGLIIVGETAEIGLPRNVYLLKITAAGAQQWTNSYGSAGNDFGAQVIECADGGFAIAGGTYGASGTDCNAYLLKTDAQGIKQWETVFGGAQFDCAWSLAQTPDSGFVLAGETQSFGANSSDIYVIKTDKRGSKTK